jgi:hypothetical protein
MVLLLLAAPAVGAQPPPVRYTLEATLHPAGDDAQPRIEGRARIALHNRTPAALHTLELHLYPNAFAHERTVFAREGGLSLRGVPLTRSGRMELRQLALSDGRDLLAASRAPDAEADRTQLTVPLPEALPPGGRIEVEATFVVHLPSLTARMGESAGFHMVAQWFPKLARLLPDGRWAQHPYHGLGEFHADFADYVVTLRVPAATVVAAPGERTAVRREGPLRVERYRLARAPDFAWAAADDLEITTAGTQGLRVEVYAGPRQRWLARRQARLTARWSTALGRRLGPLPHRRLVVILPPSAARGAAGMEYAGLFVGWHANAASVIDPRSRPLHDAVTAHELAHQWFPGLVATDEVSTPALDEGLAQWLGMDLLRREHGPDGPMARLLGVRAGAYELLAALLWRAQPAPGSLSPAHAYRPRQLAAAVYWRPALVLETIRRSWGAARLDAALGDYARRHRHGHPGVPELAAAFDRAYWPGFAQRVLLPGLRGDPFADALPPAPPGSLHNLRDRPRSDRLADAPSPPPLLARLLYATQLLLGSLGP